MASNHSELITRYRTSVSRVSKLKDQIGTEETAQKDLLVQIQASLAEELGQSVTIGAVPAVSSDRRGKTTSPNSSDHDTAIRTRILQLRSQGLSISKITSVLNEDGTTQNVSQSKVYKISREISSQSSPVSV